MTINPPTFINEGEVSSWLTTGTTKNVVYTPTAGNRLVMYGGTAFSDTTMGTPSDTQSLTWTLQASLTTTNTAPVYIWTSGVVPASSSTTFTVNLVTNGSEDWGFDILEFSGVGGFGNSASGVTVGAPSLNITTAQDHSAIVVFNNDVNTVDGTTRTWRTNAGAFTEKTYARANFGLGVYGGYHADAGVSGTYAVGLSAPTGQNANTLALEVQGLTVTAPAASPQPVIAPTALHRAASW